MGKSYTPKYRVEVKTNLNSKVVSAWETKSGPNKTGHGRPNKKNLAKWVDNYDDSFQPSGCNFHISKAIGVIPYVQEARIINQKTGEVVVVYKMPPFKAF